MVSTFHGLEVAKRGLAAQQAALATTGQNISNANTTGYTRQRVEMQATSAISIPGSNAYQLGTGVDVSKVVRLREDYLDVQIRNENKNLGYYEAKSDTLSKVEEIFNEPSDNGLAYVMDEFWKSWQELEKNPESAASRAIVSQKGVAVAETFQYLSTSLEQTQTDLKNVIQTKTSEVNSLAAQIGSLNDQISRLVPNNYEPNDLYDQRDVLIDQLSKLVNVKVANGKNGMVDVTVGNAVLVTGKTANSLTVEFDDTSGLVKKDSIKIGDQQVSLEAGELLGRIESYGTVEDGGTIPDFIQKIDTLAKVFADSINEIHKQGLNLKNISGESDIKVDFFTGTTAKDLNVNAEILKSLDLIAAATEEGTAGNSSSGNGENAKAIANIKFDNNLSFNGTTSTMDDYFRNIVAQLGIDSQQAQRMHDNSEVIVNQVENRRQSVSAVSLDEEMANMIKFQQAYNASARVMTSIDECLDKVINGMGRVGL
ncbi:flagellar hook-associated protein FlgK [Neobacillus jeddahensis]|uniref:flagellar hook-associated protein FlgK n=1 Tax=Neobacillus jeddahensis TaxID=1461580 RepID=UPI00058DA0C2|nr:flagellar hook-associated protein FlgK [Neobacillus jeddahensis]